MYTSTGIVPIVSAISGELTWTPASTDITLTTGDSGVTVVTDATPAGYQIMSQSFFRAITLPLAGSSSTVAAEEAVPVLLASPRRRH